MWKRYWLFHATDFQSLMYPCFTFCRILGIFPYKINASTFEISKLYFILMTIIICACGICDLLIIHDCIFKSNLLNTTQILEIVCYYACNGFIMIITHILSGPRMRLLQTIFKISSTLPPESYQKLSKLIHIKDIFGTMLFVLEISIYSIRNHMLKLNYKNILIVMFTGYLTLLMFEINMLYINCVCVLKACFKRLNENMIHLQKLVVKPYVPRLTYHIQRNQFLNQIFLIELKTLMRQHLIINETVQLLNIIFSLQLLATVIVTFAEITCEAYDFIVHWQGEIIITFNQHLLDTFLTTMVHYVMKVIPIVWACETGKNQAREIGTTIYDVLNSTRDKQIKDELQLFSLQILHCKNTFLTKGLAMDATFLTAMVGGITTYILQLLATVTVTFAQITSGLYDYIVHWQGEVIITFDRHLLDAILTTMVQYIMKVMLIVWACETGKNQAREISTTIYDVLNSTRDKQIKAECFLDAFLLIMVHYVMKVMLIVWVCETGKNQARKVGTTIYDVLNSTRDKQIKSELQLFSLQILHCKNTFLTKGLAMDATFLTTVINLFTVLIKNVLFFQMNMLHVNCICVLKACFKKINDDLIHMHTLMINDEKLSTSNLICHMSKNQFFLAELKPLMKQYLILTKTVQMLNRIFSLQFLAIVILSFVEITVELYFYLVRWQGEVLITFDRHLLSAFLTSMVHYIIKVTFIVWACETGKNEIQKISTTIYDIHNSIRDKQIKNELQLFSLQILHCKNTFSTKGLTVDATLVAALQIFSLQVLHCDNTFSAKCFTIDAKLLAAVTCFTRINDNLMSMRRFIANNEPSVHRLNYHNQRNPFLIMELKALKIQHLTISDTVQMLNIIFSLQLVTTVVMTLSTVTICLYFYILAAKYSLVNTNFFKIVLFHMYFLLYIAYFLIKVLLIVWACETGRAQAQQITTSIHDVFNVTTDKEIKDELQIFSLQVLHCDNTFSAKCFTIDAKLLAAVSNILHTFIN
ncbi:GR28B protein, partial [Acromyrmex heyeri]